MKTKNFPLVSIITAAYNREDLISQTIDSILNQKYPNLEYIIIDDGSKDKTVDVIKKYGKKVKLFTQKNMGETKTVNKGFKLAKGKYVAVISSDDPLLPGSIKKMVSVLEKNPTAIVAYPDWIVIDQNGKRIKNITLPDYDYLTMIKNHYCMPGPGSFIRKIAVDKYGPRDTSFKYVGDFEFWLRLGKYAKFIHVPHFLATFRVHNGSQGIYARGSEMALEHKLLTDKIYSWEDLPKEALKFKNAAYSSAYFHAATESLASKEKIKYYTKSLFSNPLTFLGKIKYEAVKYKNRK